jgi:cytochrome c oxidase subunit 2
MDAPKPFQFGFQDPASPIAEGLNDLHNYIFLFLILVCTFVSWMLYIIISEFNVHKYHSLNNMHYDYVKARHLTHGVFLEIIWTLIPTFILLVIAIPSFALLYAMDEVIDPELTVKVIGHQWYWSYEFSDFNEGLNDDINFDSYMIPEDELAFGALRLLETDTSLVLPVNTHIRVIITAGDVLHSWAIPSLGVKMDAVPGRLNQSSLFIKRDGVFFGQCSELCGVNHGFMPIIVNAVNIDMFLSWILSQKN